MNIKTNHKLVLRIEFKNKLNNLKMTNKPMNLRLTTILFLFTINYQLLTINCYSQSQGVGINVTGAAADNSAMLDVSGTGKGLLVPRMSTAQRPASPVESLMIYNTDTQCFEAYNEATSQWVNLACIGSGWKCGDTMIDIRDAQKYKTVLIGTQCWMAQNLNYGTYTAVTNPPQQSGSKYCYNNDNSCPLGGLYEWANLMQGASSCNGTGAGQPACTTPVQGLCPAGWHIPSNYEWTLLEQTVCAISPSGGNCSANFPFDENAAWRGTTEGGKLKEAGTTQWSGPNTGATNISGFTAFGGGNSQDGMFVTAGIYGYYWSSTTSTMPGGNYAWMRILEYNVSTVAMWHGGKAAGFSARCVKNN